MSNAVLLEQITGPGMTQEQAYDFFDSLAPVGLDEMIGVWRGKEAFSGHPMEGLLNKLNWFGKEFVGEEDVHPLVFEKENGGLFYADPIKVMGGQVTDFKEQNIATLHSKARMRMLEYRGKVSATMLYDDLPINDMFRKINDDTLLGVMDFKGGPSLGYFFVLERVK